MDDPRLTGFTLFSLHAEWAGPLHGRLRLTATFMLLKVTGSPSGGTSPGQVDTDGALAVGASASG